MDHAAIASAYDEIADRWLDDQFDQANGIPQHARALAFLRNEADGWALDVGCGCNTRFNASMREHGLRIEGVDISKHMLALAREADPDVLLQHAERTPASGCKELMSTNQLCNAQRQRKRPLRLKRPFSEFWLPDLDSNQGPAD